MLIYTKPVSKMTEREYRACHRLNLGLRGMMRGMLETCRDYREYEGRVVLAYEGQVLVGWALKFRRREWTQWDLFIYVRASHRRRGIGRKLLAHARMGHRELLRVYPTTLGKTLYAPLKQANRVKYAAGSWR